MTTVRSLQLGPLLLVAGPRCPGPIDGVEDDVLVQLTSGRYEDGSRWTELLAGPVFLGCYRDQG